MLDHIFIKGLSEYLHYLHAIPKTTSYDIASQVNATNLNSLFTLDLKYYFPQQKIDELAAEVKNFPLKPSCFILGLGFSVATTKLILDFFGKSDSIVATVTENPYSLLDVEGITFKKVDKIAIEYFNISEKAPIRLKTLVSHSLNNYCNKNGHLFCLLDTFKSLKLDIDVSKEDFIKYLKELILERKIVLEGRIRLYPSIYYKAEKESAELLAGLLVKDKKSNFFKNVDPEKFIEGYEEIQTKSISEGVWKNLQWGDSKFKLSEEQRDTVKKFIEERFFIVTGLPGTGKTCVTKALVDISRSQGLSVCLMTPTGISAKRLATTCNYDAFTIHKILGYDGTSWKRNENNRLDYDVMIVDEFSMVDQILLYRLLKALPEKEFIMVFIGDAAQLPSVGSGNVLKELISCNKVSHVKLTKIFRQEDTSDIILNAHLINSGNNNLSMRKDFVVYQEEDEDKVLEVIIKIVDKLEKEDKNYKILSPTYKGTLGVTNLNIILQDIINPEVAGEFLKSEHVSFRVDDKVMIIKNDPMNDVYNGEQGIIVELNRRNQKVVILINSRIIEYSFKDIYSYIALDYIRTIHRCQGQEYDYIIMPYVMGFSIQLQRNLLYTAITRAKKKVFIVGQKTAIDKSIRNNSTTKRNTLLSCRILSNMDQPLREIL